MNGDNKDLDKNATDNVVPETTGANRSFDPMFAQQWQKPSSQKPSTPARNTPAADQPTPEVAGEAEDILFEATDQPVADPEVVSFDEAGRSRWAGSTMTPDEMGIATRSQPGFLSGDDELEIDSEQELELIDGFANPEPAVLQEGEVVDESSAQGGDTEELAIDEQPLAEAAQGDESMDGEVYVLDESETTEAADSAFGQDGELADAVANNDGVDEPLEGTDEPMEHPDLDDVEAPSFEEEFATQETVGESESHDETPMDYEAAELVAVAGAPVSTGRIFKLFGKLAAAAALVAGAGVAVLHPEWVGLTLTPELVERVQIARPNTSPGVPKPVAHVAQTQPAAPAVEPAPAQPTNLVSPEPQQIAQVEPMPNVATQPVAPSSSQPQVDTNAADQLAANSTLPRYLPAGESLWIGQFDGGAKTTAEWATVAPGSRAFAQLENGNFFIGSVKAVAADALVLTVKHGEVMLPRAEIRKVTTLDSRDYADLQRATQGFLKLSNDNRLVGEILESVGDDHYVLQMHSDRIVIPRSEVQEVVQRGGNEGLRFGSLGDEEQWLRDVAGRQLESQRSGSFQKSVNRTATQPKPTEAKLPVKQEQRKVPSTGK